MPLDIFTMTDLTRQDNTTNNYRNLTIITLNVNGLYDDNKRQQILQYLQNKKQK